MLIHSCLNALPVIPAVITRNLILKRKNNWRLTSCMSTLKKSKGKSLAISAITFPFYDENSPEPVAPIKFQFQK